MVIKETGRQFMAEPLLQMQEVAFGYGRQPLFYDVSLAIQKGEMVGLLGPNGSGKTTLLRLMSGALQPQQGQVMLDERELRHWGRRRVAQRIAVVPQELHMPFAFTVEQMVGMGRTPFQRSFWGTYDQQDREAVQEAMHAAGVTSFADRLFNELSGGERQRVTVAMALAQRPSVLLLDEPTSHLDIKYQIETLELVQQLNREHVVTIVAAIHDLNLAARYFPRLVLFQRGIVADGSPAEVLESGLLRRVYGVKVQVGILRGAEHLSVLPPSQQVEHVAGEEHEKPLVHVIAGGGSGELMMRVLADVHIPFSAGALNIGDSDHTLALRLAKDVITEQPYAPISVAAVAAVRSYLQTVSLLVICPTAIGPGNVVLLQEAVRALQQGLPVLLLLAPVGDTNLAETYQSHKVQMDLLATYDYTGGQGLSYLRTLIERGAFVTASVSVMLEEIRKYVVEPNQLRSASGHPV
jgi:iron complex transport system ATP-binding protein